METIAIINHISNWLSCYAEKAEMKGFVIGISGGVDSAVTSVLAAKTNKPLLCIELPIYQNPKHSKRAKKHIAWLKNKFNNVSSIEINLTPTFDAFIQQLPKNKNNNELALANTRARLRMCTLYYFAQANNALVVGTGNKVEDFGIGFFTKYGDGGVDISPIADLLKTEVYSLGKELGINSDILSAPPSDGLWKENKTDEQQIGATYPELEWAMNLSENEKPLNKRDKKVLEIYKQFNQTNQHKMQAIPVCIIPNNLK